MLSFPRVALMALALGTATVPALMADTTTNASGSCSAQWHHHGKGVLTKAEKAQLEKAKAAALAANPSLQTEEAALKQQKNSAVAGTDHKALKDERKAFHAKLRTAELNIDPTLAPIFAKLDAAHHGKGKHHTT